MLHGSGMSAALMGLSAHGTIRALHMLSHLQNTSPKSASMHALAWTAANAGRANIIKLQVGPAPAYARPLHHEAQRQ